MSAPTDPTRATSPHIAVVSGILQARLSQMSPARPVYESGSEPGNGRNYLTFQLTRRFGGNPRIGGPLTPSGWRLFLRAVGEGTNNARTLLDTGSDAVEDHIVGVAGERSTPLRFEGEDGVREDDDDNQLYTGARTFTYSF